MISLDSHARIRVLVFSFLILLLKIYLGTIPMFWDMSYISEVSSLILNSNFTQIIFTTTDNGTPPLYSIYLATIWYFFGKSLLTTHLASVPFIVIILWQFQLLLNRYTNKKFHTIAFIILLAEPCFITQTILSGYDLAISCLFLLAVNSICNNKTNWKLVSVILLPLLSSRAFSFVAAIFIIDFIMNRKNIKVSILASFMLPYFISFLVFSCWLYFHYLQTSWFFNSEGRESLMKTGNITWVFRHLIYILWKIIDSGRVFLYMIIAIISINMCLKKHDNKIKEVKSLSLILVAPVIAYIIFFLLLRFPVAHRYFMVVNITSIILLLVLLTNHSLRISNMILFLIIISLLSGNFWIYPEKYGNAWDTSLKVLPYFKTENKMHDFIINEKIDPELIGAQFPMNFNRRYTHLEDNSFSYSDMDSNDLQFFKYIMLSNISNSTKQDQRDELKKKWILLKQYQSGQIYIQLFKNPALEKK